MSTLSKVWYCYYKGQWLVNWLYKQTEYKDRGNMQNNNLNNINSNTHGKNTFAFDQLRYWIKRISNEYLSGCSSE